MRESVAPGSDPPRRAGRRVRRTVVLGGGQQLRREDEQHHLPRGLGVSAGPAARAQGEHEQGGEVAPHHP